jgi:predicted nucleotidyltransferase
MNPLHFATPTHQRAFDLVQEILHADERVLALTLTGSAARNEGSFDSDVDFDIFFAEGAPTAEIVARVEEV